MSDYKLNADQTLGNVYDPALNAINIGVQDQITSPFQYFLMREDKIDITLTVPAALDDTVLNVSAGHGFTGTGEYLCAFEGSRFIQSEVKSVATNAITLALPLAFDLTTSAIIIRGSIDMNINGAVSPQSFICQIRDSIVPIDVTAVSIGIVHATAADDSLFGDISALGNGLFFRQYNSRITNFGNFKANGDFFNYGGEITYSDKAGGGEFSTNIDFFIRDVYGVVVRLDPMLNDKFLSQVRDDLSALSRVRISLKGHFTSGE